MRKKSFVGILVWAALLGGAHAKILYFPHLGDGDGLSTLFVVTSSSDKPARGKLGFFAQDGTAQSLPGIGSPSIELDLASNESITFQSDGTSDPLITGYAVVELDREEVSGLSI